MFSVIIRHKVEDFEKWHAAFLSFAEMNARHGASNAEVYRAIDDHNDVTVKQDFATSEAAQNMLRSEEILKALGQTGVVGLPTILIAEKIG